MRIVHSLLGYDREFDYRHVKPDLKIGETKSTAYPICKAGVYPIFLPNGSGVFVGDIALRNR